MVVVLLLDVAVDDSNNETGRGGAIAIERGRGLFGLSGCKRGGGVGAWVGEEGAETD